MKQAFIIMQIGNKELDEVCKEAIVPALRAFDLDPKRVDKHNKGGLLKSEIITFINEAEIIVADLTNERPNCYLEVGYAMGRNKYQNLILTAREDHNPDSPHHIANGSKVHFDLAGYDILWWDKDQLEAFKMELEKRIKRRLEIISTTGQTIVSPIDVEWVKACQSEALADLTPLGNVLIMEAEMALFDSELNISQDELLKHAEASALHTTGWPIGVVLHVDEKRPKPRKDGITARIFSSGKSNYDYWALRKDGQFYMLRTEAPQMSGTLSFDTKIFRITELFYYCHSLYTELGVQGDTKISIRVNHSGLRNCTMSSDQHRALLDSYTASEDTMHSEVETTLEEIPTKIVDLVETIIQPLFVLFDYFTVPRNTVEQIVKQFVVIKK